MTDKNVCPTNKQTGIVYHAHEAACHVHNQAVRESENHQNSSFQRKLESSIYNRLMDSRFRGSDRLGYSRTACNVSGSSPTEDKRCLSSINGRQGQLPYQIQAFAGRTNWGADHQRIRFTLSISRLPCFLYIVTIIARPTATSAAATAITKKTNTCPSIFGR